jgi:hypothetical protein
VVEPIQELWVRSPRCSHGYGAVIPPSAIERGAQAGIEPAKAAWMTQHIGSAGAGQIMSTQLHSRMCRPAGGLHQSLESEPGDA